MMMTVIVIVIVTMTMIVIAGGGCPQAISRPAYHSSSQCENRTALLSELCPGTLIGSYFPPKDTGTSSSSMR